MINALFDQTVNGLVIGNIYALIAVGLALIFGVAGLINFAHGSVYMVGAYVGWLCVARAGLPLWIALPIVVAACALLGVIIERFGLRALASKARIAPLLGTIGIGLILDQLAQLIFGPFPQAFPNSLPSRRIPIGGVSIGALDLVIAAISLAGGAALWAFLRFSRLGWAVRATAQDREAAQQMGVDVNRVNALVFAIASALGGVAGVLVGMYFGSVYPTMGFQAGLKGFAAALLGGMGSVPGAIVGALLLGVIESYGVALLGASYRNLFAFAILLGVLVLRPGGLFGSRRGLPPEPLTGTFVAPNRALRIPGWLGWVLVVSALGLPLVVRDPYLLQMLTNAWIYGLLALSLTLVSGVAGQTSLGHAGLLAIGGYASALLAVRLGWPVALAIPAAALMTALLGTLLVFPAFRLRGHYMAIATLGIGEIVSLTVLNWASLTNGAVGLSALPPLSLFGRALVTTEAVYWTSLAALLLAFAVQQRLDRSHLGRTLRAIREDEVAAQSFGVGLDRYKALAFGVGGFAAGLSGALTAHQYSYINHETFGNTISILGLTMAILGGMGNALGAIAGAVILIGLPEAFRFLGDARMLFYGVVLLLLICYRPQGLLGTV